jgi:hypothetical protein
MSGIAPAESRGNPHWSDSYFWNGLYQVATWLWTYAAA